MKLTVLGSSSNGNGYLIHDESEALILETGIRYSTALKAMDYNSRIVVAALISHTHGDHAKYMNSYLEKGVMVMANSSVLSLAEPKYTYLCKEVQPMKGYKAGRFSIVPFELQHDVPCLGFLIDHPDTGTLVFITDTYLCEYIFPPSSRHIIIECNYADHILDRNILSGSVHPSMRNRLLETHLELKTCIGILKANDLSKVQTITLAHLSSQNSNEAEFCREVTAHTGIPVYAAKKGFTTNLNKY